MTRPEPGAEEQRTGEKEGLKDNKSPPSSLAVPLGIFLQIYNSKFGHLLLDLLSCDN